MIGVLTYNIPHRKTYDTLCLLKAKGILEDITVFSTPFHYKKSFVPLLEHRPKNNGIPHPQEICKNFEFHYVEEFQENILPHNSLLLICGSGIIPQSIIRKYRVINSHPGFLPNVRGLDALKWAIYDGQPIGVTTHQLGEEIDAGLIIKKDLVPIYFNDTFHAVAQRQYEMEVRMLVEAIDEIDSANEIVDPQNYPLRKRMPHEFETRLIKKFNAMVDALPIE